jgi:PTS system N-acetylglucosamine-specific IIC component
MALTSFLTGVTEPIEFTFIFLAPLLYALHAVLTGAAMVIMHLLDVRLGFSFSAGLFDYVLNFDRASRPWLLIPVGIAYAFIYYAAFRLAIRVFNLKTPGREVEDAAISERPVAGESDRGRAFVSALGGAGNLSSVDACTTRLRLVVVDQNAIDDTALKRLGARGILRPTPNALQVVLGPIADQVAGEIRTRLREPVYERGAEAAELLAALGGQRNVRQVELVSGRTLITVAEAGAVREQTLRSLVPRGIAKTSGGVIHLLLGPGAQATGQALQRLIGEAGQRA